MNNPWLNYGWLWSHRPEQHIVLGKIIFYSASFSVEEINEIKETEFDSQ